MKYSVTRTHTEKYEAKIEADSVAEAIEKAARMDPDEFEHIESGPYAFNAVEDKPPFD